MKEDREELANVRQERRTEFWIFNRTYVRKKKLALDLDTRWRVDVEC